MPASRTGRRAPSTPCRSPARCDAVAVEVVDVEPAQLGDAQRSAVEQLQHRVIAQRDRVACRRRRRELVEHARSARRRSRPSAACVRAWVRRVAGSGRRRRDRARSPTRRSRAPRPCAARSSSARRRAGSPRHSHSRRCSRSTSASGMSPADVAQVGEVGSVGAHGRGREAAHVGEMRGIRVGRLARSSCHQHARRRSARATTHRGAARSSDRRRQRARPCSRRHPSALRTTSPSSCSRPRIASTSSRGHARFGVRCRRRPPRLACSSHRAPASCRRCAGARLAGAAPGRVRESDARAARGRRRRS